MKPYGAHWSRRCYQDAQLLVSHQLHQPGDDARLHHHVDAIVVAVREVGDGPAGVRQNVLVGVVEQLDERWKNLQERRLKVLYRPVLKLQFSSAKLQKPYSVQTSRVGHCRPIKTGYR